MRTLFLLLEKLLMKFYFYIFIFKYIKNRPSGDTKRVSIFHCNYCNYCNWVLENYRTLVIFAA